MFIFSVVSAIVGLLVAVVRGFPNPLDTDQEGRGRSYAQRRPPLPFGTLGNLDTP